MTWLEGVGEHPPIPPLYLAREHSRAEQTVDQHQQSPKQEGAPTESAKPSKPKKQLLLPAQRKGQGLFVVKRNPRRP